MIYLIPSSKDFGKFVPSSLGREDPRLSLKQLHGRSHGRVPTEGGIHVRFTDINVGILAPECCRMREYDICGVNAGADDHQPSAPFAGGVHGGHEAVHRALVQLRGAATLRSTVPPWAFFGIRGVTVRNRRTHRYIGLTASVAVAGVKSSR